MKTILKRALLMAEKCHLGQSREEGAEYIIHPIRAAIFLFKEMGIADSNIIAAALLHDVVEDCDVSFKEIEKKFGREISGLVRNLTRVRPKNETEEKKIESKKKYFEKILKSDKKTRLIKCADLIDNMRSWLLIPEKNPARKKFFRWFKEAEKYYIPIAEKTNQYSASAMKETLAYTKSYMNRPGG